MTDKISLYGLSGSGKSCFIFAMSQALSQGLPFRNGELLTVITPDPRQMLRLYKAYEKMVNGIWPDGNVESVNYNFHIRKALNLLMSLDITDFRGGLLDSMDEDDKEEQDKLFRSYVGSSVLLFFIGADKVKAAMNGDFGARCIVDILSLDLSAIAVPDLITGCHILANERYFCLCALGIGYLYSGNLCRS